MAESENPVTRKIVVGQVYSAKIGGAWVPVLIWQSLGHGRYQGAIQPSGSVVKVSTDNVRGEGQTLEAWTASRTPVEHGLPTPAASTATTTGKKAKTARAAGVPKGPRQSMVNAAILVLANAKDIPMGAKAIVEKATADGLYEPGKGKTPHATLYSAMLREARDDGDKARFRKAQRGLWELTDAGKTEADAIKEAFAAK